MAELMGILGGQNSDIYEETIKSYLDDRKIIFNQDVDTGILEDVILHILKWNKEDEHLPVEARKKIFIYLASDGGDVIAGNALISVIKQSVTPVVGVVFSIAASMASCILMSCHERIALENSVVLIHDGAQGVYSSANKAKDVMKFYEKLDNLNRDLVISRTNITAEEFDENKDREQYFLASEAKEKGIIDKIIGVDVPLSYIL